VCQPASPPLIQICFVMEILQILCFPYLSVKASRFLLSRFRSRSFFLLVMEPTFGAIECVFFGVVLLFMAPTFFLCPFIFNLEALHHTIGSFFPASLAFSPPIGAPPLAPFWVAGGSFFPCLTGLDASSFLFLFPRYDLLLFTLLFWQFLGEYGSPFGPRCKSRCYMMGCAIFSPLPLQGVFLYSARSAESSRSPRVPPSLLGATFFLFAREGLLLFLSRALISAFCTPLGLFVRSRISYRGSFFSAVTAAFFFPFLSCFPRFFPFWIRTAPLSLDFLLSFEDFFFSFACRSPRLAGGSFPFLRIFFFFFVDFFVRDCSLSRQHARFFCYQRAHLFFATGTGVSSSVFEPLSYEIGRPLFFFSHAFSNHEPS